MSVCEAGDISFSSSYFSVSLCMLVFSFLTLSGMFSLLLLKYARLNCVFPAIQYTAIEHNTGCIVSLHGRNRLEVPGKLTVVLDAERRSSVLICSLHKDSDVAVAISRNFKCLVQVRKQCVGVH